jgi:hypothetical protein
MPKRKKGASDRAKILVVAERRARLDLDMLSTALFSWVMGNVRNKSRDSSLTPSGQTEPTADVEQNEAGSP